MKAGIFLMMCLVIFTSVEVRTQTTEPGIFLSAQDFKSQKLTHASAHTHIKLHEVFKKDLIEVKTKDSTYTYKKKNVFGYRDAEGSSYRIYKNKIYPILNPGETILIYKVANALPQKGQVQTYSYYFSVDSDKEITSLTIQHLEEAFKDNKAYQELLEIHFTNTSNLLEYDDIHKMYKVNRLLEMTKK